MYYPVARRTAPESPIWLDDNTWACRRHVPSAKFHAGAQRCLLGCPVERPYRDGMPLPAPRPVVVKPPEVESSPVVESPPVVKKPVPVKNPAPVTKSNEWDHLDTLDAQGLAQHSITELRSYASNHLGIRGASKIPGGKDALITRILAKQLA